MSLDIVNGECGENTLARMVQKGEYVGMESSLRTHWRDTLERHIVLVIDQTITDCELCALIVLLMASDWCQVRVTAE